MMASLYAGCCALLEESEDLLAERQLDDAVMAFQAAKAAGADPDRCEAGLWMAYMLLGDFEQAWRQSDSIRARGNPDPHRFWDGTPLGGKRVMVRCLHGLGDTVQFLRYLPRVKAIAAHVTLEVPPRMLELAPYFDGVDEVVAWGEDAPLQAPTWDVQIEIMELPYIFRTQLAELPIAVQYLRRPHSADACGEASLQVGMAWTAGSWNPSRGVPLKHFGPLFGSPDCVFWSLESSHSAAEKSCTVAACMRTDERCRSSLLGMASRIAQVDVVITVDTLAAHLAGALGVRTFLLLQYQADWRWMHQRSDSPWYPSLRLCRQPAPGAWDCVIAEVQQELCMEVENKRRQGLQA